MNYERALEVYKIVKEIEQNHDDMRIFTDARKAGIKRAQIQFECTDGTYVSKSYEHDRLDLLINALNSKTAELITKLKEY